MKAIKCDRCLRYFDEEIGVIQYFDKASDDHYHQLDVCPDCLEKFFDFMRMREAKADEED